MPPPVPTTSVEIVSVPIGRWAVATAPVQIRTLLGSCAGVILYDRVARIGGVAHVVLPDSRGSADHPGKFADTAIPALITDLERKLGRTSKGRLTAKVAGGASMFQTGASTNIGRMNNEAVELILAGLGIPVVARDIGGDTGRRLTFDTLSGIVSIKIPGGADYQI
ncbi:chemotaxis protein CheD [Singulisphaera sp. Ch08]|uniref:Probable chemoreceptor glutamine deamidase CheD n=1 Tax=Singulisphaera sp. Ch08 TaxID=3120278 RepID=A0AAU7CIW6_9BACT